MAKFCQQTSKAPHFGYLLFGECSILKISVKFQGNEDQLALFINVLIFPFVIIMSCNGISAVYNIDVCFLAEVVCEPVEFDGSFNDVLDVETHLFCGSPGLNCHQQYMRCWFVP